MKKILVVTQHFYPENFRFNDLIIDLGRDNEVTVLTGVPNYPEGSFFEGYKLFSPNCEKYKNVRIIRVPLIPRGSSKMMLAFNYLSFLLSGSIYAFFISLFKKFDRVLVCQTSPVFMAVPAIIYKFTRRTKVFLWITDLWPESLMATNTIKNQTLINALDQIVRWIYENVDVILVSCKGFEGSIRAKHPSAIIEYFPYWAESFYQQTSPDPSYSFKSKFKLMFAGNIGEAQNLELLAEAISKIPKSMDIEVIIIGNGRGGASFERALDQFGVRDKFICLGALPAERMPALFAHADALYLSLRKDPIFEITVPSKLQSYMACGKPVIASVDGEAAAIIKNAKCGYVGKAGSVTQLVDAILAASVLSLAELQFLGDNSQKYYKQYFNRDKSMRDIRQFLGV